jgi:hypothetical protein
LSTGSYKKPSSAETFVRNKETEDRRETYGDIEIEIERHTDRQKGEKGRWEKEEAEKRER